MVPDNDEKKYGEESAEPQAGARDEMANWMELADPKEVKRGDIITGTVVGKSEEGVHVDLGAKLEGLISRTEFPSESDYPAVDEKIEVAVLRIDDEDGVIRISKRRADFDRVWVNLEELAKAGGVVEGMVTERVKGGLRVDVGVPGFVPASQVETRDVRALERYVGRSLRLRVLEADRRSKKVILSHRQIVEEERSKRRDETLAKLEEGIVIEGKVRSLTSYGAFVDLGGVDGLLHVSEMSWTRIKDPAEVLSVGETIQVTVLEVNTETGKISLSRRQILPDPWKEAARQLRSGQMVHARITRVVRTGAFAQLSEAGIEGFIPISEMSSTRRINDPSDVLSTGQEVDLRIMDIRLEARRMSLSLSGAEQERERQEYKAYMAEQPKASLTLGDQFGALLQSVAPAEEEPEAEEVVATETAEEPPGSEVSEAAEAVEAAEVAEEEAVVEAEAPAEAVEESGVPEEATEAPEVAEAATIDETAETVESEAAAETADGSDEPDQA